MVSSGWVSSLSQNFTDKTDIWRDICVVSTTHSSITLALSISLGILGTDGVLPPDCGHPPSYGHSDTGPIDQKKYHNKHQILNKSNQFM